MYAADISQASVLMLFLLPESLRKLLPKFLDMKAGSRIVSNTYEMAGWQSDTSETVRGTCAAFCIVYLYTVPAKVAGAWSTGEGGLILFEQDFQRVSGTFELDGISVPLENGRLDGAQISFAINRVEYSGRVDGDSIEGVAKGRTVSRWRATRVGEAGAPIR